MALGKTTFAMCAACHGPDGTGLKVGPALMAPSMVGSKVLLGDPENSLLVVLKGIAKEDMKFMGMMAPGSYTHLRAPENVLYFVFRLLL
mgnify:CR=1 FL=1